MYDGPAVGRLAGWTEPGPPAHVVEERLLKGERDQVPYLEAVLMAHHEVGDAGAARDASQQGKPELIPRDFLRVIAVWSLIPSYLLAGGLIGYLLDQWLGWFPYLTGACLLLALIVAVRDMNRLSKEL
jgi:hypothetical protein